VVNALEFEAGCDLWARKGDVGELGHGSRTMMKCSQWASDVFPARGLLSNGGIVYSQHALGAWKDRGEDPEPSPAAGDRTDG
jgi:hypothetical protein